MEIKIFCNLNPKYKHGNQVLDTEGICICLTEAMGAGGAYGASGVIEIETMQQLINADSNGNARAIRACYGQCGFDSVFRGGRARNNRSYGRNRTQNRRLHTGQQGQSRET